MSDLTISIVVDVGLWAWAGVLVLARHIDRTERRSKPRHIDRTERKSKPRH